MKTYAVIITPEALEQLRAIEHYIASASGYPAVAERYVDALMTFCESLDTFPVRGTLRDDIRPGLRLVPYRDSADIAFTVSEDAVWIVAVFHGGQDYEAALHPDSTSKE